MKRLVAALLALGVMMAPVTACEAPPHHCYSDD